MLGTAHEGRGARDQHDLAASAFDEGGSAARTRRTAPVTLTSRLRCHPGSSRSPTEPKTPVPALATRTSKPPNDSRAASTAAVICPPSVVSPATLGRQPWLPRGEPDAPMPAALEPVTPSRRSPRLKEGQRQRVNTSCERSLGGGRPPLRPEEGLVDLDRAGPQDHDEQCGQDHEDHGEQELQRHLLGHFLGSLTPLLSKLRRLSP